MENIVLTINEKRISCSPGTSILEAAAKNGIKIPHLCYHPDLKPFGACRLCLVEDEKTGRLMASCVTPAAQDMVIRTDTARVVGHRRNIVRLMIAEHPESCIVCSKGNRCQLRWVAAQMGVGETRLYSMPNYKPLEQANPFIIRDLSKCILCGKCIRADHELVVVGAIDYNLRGFHSRPATVHELGLERSVCTFCGTCVSMCPTGALSTKNSRYVGSPETETVSICSFCGVGCSLSMGQTAGKVIDVNPANLPDTVNQATLCVRGHFAHDFLNSADRLIAPLMPEKKAEGRVQMTPVAWDQALAHVAARLVRIKDENGPQSIGFMGSSKCSNEENYLFQKIARVFIGTNNVDNGGYISGQFLSTVLDLKTGGGYRPNPLSTIAKADMILVLGADPGHSLPVVSYSLKRAAQKGIPIVVVDPRKTELVSFASLWLPIKPQSDLELINALAALLHKENAYASEFIDRFVEGFSIFSYSLSSLDIEKVSRVTGLAIQRLHEAVNILKGKRIAFLIGHGILQQRYSIHTMGAILNLSLITGSLGSENAGIFMLARENNQAGAMDMGAVPALLPGRMPVDDDPIRKTWEKNWKIKISPDPGLNMVRMIEAAESGRLKALYIMGENPLRALPQPQRVKAALEKLDFIVVQDILNNEIVKLADVALPGAAVSEKSGCFTNLEGRIQNFAPVVPPPGTAKPDWEILDLLATRLGSQAPYGSVKNIRKEIRNLVLPYAEMNGHGQGWVKSISPMAAFGADGAKKLMSFSPVVSIQDDQIDADYPYTAILGSLRYHLGSGTRTSASARIQEFDLKGEIAVSEPDADQLKLKDGDTVQLKSRWGVIRRKIVRSSRIGPGQLFVPLAFEANDAMNLIDLADLANPKSAGWKTCAVKIKKA
ncbi:MAG: molybdopterin-dependent oxidoreductase [Desulfobacterales bacterium]